MIDIVRSSIKLNKTQFNFIALVRTFEEESLRKKRSICCEYGQESSDLYKSIESSDLYKSIESQTMNAKRSAENGLHYKFRGSTNLVDSTGVYQPGTSLLVE